MDRSTPPSSQPALELPAPLARDPVPLDIDEDPADESIYSLGYRTRVGVIVRDPTGAQAPADQAPLADAEPVPTAPSPGS